MAKFYAQCGPVRMVLTAWDTEGAALSLIDSALQPHLWIYSDSSIANRDRKSHLMIEALLHLDSSVKISEQGFDRDDAKQIEVPELIQYWHRLMVSLNRLVRSSVVRDEVEECAYEPEFDYVDAPKPR